MNTDQRYPKSFPAIWAVEYGDDCRIGLTSGYQMPDNTVLRMVFIEATHPKELGFWISGALNDDSLKQLESMPTSSPDIRMANANDCQRARDYFNYYTSGDIIPNTRCKKGYTETLETPIAEGRHLVIPDY